MPVAQDTIDYLLQHYGAAEWAQWYYESASTYEVEGRNYIATHITTGMVQWLSSHTREIANMFLHVLRVHANAEVLTEVLKGLHRNTFYSAAAANLVQNPYVQRRPDLYREVTAQALELALHYGFWYNTDLDTVEALLLPLLDSQYRIKQAAQTYRGILQYLIGESD